MKKQPILLLSRLRSRFVVSFVLGMLSALVFAPTYLIPLAIIGFSGLFLLIDKEKSLKKSFWLGWSFGFGHFIVGFYWISISLFVDIVAFGWLLPFSITLIPATAAIYIGLTALATKKMANILKVSKLQRIIIFTVFWLFFEYLRSILLSGFPWNLIGYSLIFSTNISQVASIVGIYGLSLLALLIFTIPALLIEITDYNLQFNEDSKGNFIVISALLSLIVVISAWGNNRINSNELEYIENGNVRVVQPSIKQANKWDPEYKYKSFLKNIDLANSKRREDVNYVIWSESAIPYALSHNSLELLLEIKKAIPQDAALVSGAIRAKFDLYGQVDEVFNSVFAIDDDGHIKDIYDKRHLVPFGEYIPFQKYVPFISKITNGGVGFSSGNDVKIIQPQTDLPSFLPLICYEAIFTNLSRSKEERPDFLLNITNDGWFGRSSGPYQHLAMAQTRSIEYGLPLIRAANNGVSAYIDPYGRVVDKMPLNKIDIMDVKLVEKLEVTLYDKYGMKILLFILILILSPLILSKLKNVFRPNANRLAYRKKTKKNSH